MDTYSFTAGIFTGLILAFAIWFGTELLIRLLKQAVDTYWENKMYRAWRKATHEYVKKQMEDASNAGHQ